MAMAQRIKCRNRVRHPEQSARQKKKGKTMCLKVGPFMVGDMCSSASLPEKLSNLFAKPNQLPTHILCIKLLNHLIVGVYSMSDLPTGR
jgi:hypothetical protein